MANDVMLDMETLGVTADSVILSLGAVKFDLCSGKIEDAAFYASISVESNLDAGRRIREDTLKWWMKQSSAAQQVFFEEKQPLHDVLVSFAEWLGDASKTCMWSMGADFDMPMLAHAYTQAGLVTPWNFWNNRCARTYKNLPGASAVTMARSGTHHNALSDAISQATYISEIHNKLFPLKKGKT